MSLQVFSLPARPSGLSNCLDASLLTCPPEDEGSLVVLFSGNRAAFCRPGDDAWVVQRCKTEGYDDEELSFREVLVCNGVFYCMVKRGMFDFVVMEINSDGSGTKLSFRFPGLLEHPDIYYPPSPRVMILMAEGCGEVYKFELYLDVFNEKRVVGGVTWRLDFARMAWVKVKSLKGHVFFSCSCYSVSCHGESYSGGLYFFLPGDNTLYFYRAEDATVTAMLPCSNLKTSWLDPFWILPCYPRFVLLA